MNPAPAPRAIRHFGLAMMEARAERTRKVLRPVEFAPRRTVVRLWLPLTPLFLLLAPFALLLAPLGYLAPRGLRVNPFAAAFAVGRVLMAFSGTVIDVDVPDALVRIKIL